jgi:hypothetical protein
VLTLHDQHGHGDAAVRAKPPRRLSDSGALAY